MIRRGVAVAFAAVVAAAGVCVGSTAAITFGVPDGNAHPYVGSVIGTVEVSPGEFESYQWCSGTLISPTVFVTASHCFSGFDDVTFTVTFAPVIDADGDGLVDASVALLSGAAHVNPLYSTGGANNTYDVAVFVLDAPRPGPYATLAPTGFLDTQSAKRATYTTVGYGTVRDDKTGGQHALELGTERLHATQTINSVTNSWVTFSMNPSTGNGGTCYGDSGGPHLYDGSSVLVALTVTGDRWCRSTDKDYRLDTTDAQSFIASFLAP